MSLRRASYLFLCIGPILIMPLAGARPLRIPGVHPWIGIVLFAAMAACVWILGVRRPRPEAESARRLAIAGGLLVVPFALIALLWVGLGTPWDATPPENVMRYAVLLVGSVAVTAALVLVWDLLLEASERLFATLGLSAAVLAGAGYLVWLSLEMGAHATRVRLGTVPESITALGSLLDVLLFAACALTYLATAAFAGALGRVRWLRQGPSTAYVTLSLIALAFLVLRGLAFPDPTQSSTPWYARPGFIVGIPAVPWLMPYFLGVVLLRRSANEMD